ncbi:MAG TPA: hypothetical protein VHQ91_05410, partial [Geminicoccaceae bacterium]|nr:hypothetical protein [Geminicoccaceae bacterium]
AIVSKLSLTFHAQRLPSMFHVILGILAPLAKSRLGFPGSHGPDGGKAAVKVVNTGLKSSRRRRVPGRVSRLVLGERPVFERGTLPVEQHDTGPKVGSSCA